MFSFLELNTEKLFYQKSAYFDFVIYSKYRLISILQVGGQILHPIFPPSFIAMKFDGIVSTYPKTTPFERNMPLRVAAAGGAR